MLETNPGFELEIKKEQETQRLKDTYEGSEIYQAIKRQTEQGETNPVGLFSDIDNTFRRAGTEEAMQEIISKAEQENIPINAVTGNDYQGVMRRIESGELPYFDSIIGSAGTEIWALHTAEDGSRNYKKDENYELLLKETGYVRSEVVARSRQMVEDLLSTHPEWKLDFQNPDKEKELEANPDPKYQTFKVSFYFFNNPDGIDKVAQEMEKYFPNLSVVICEEIGYNSKLPADAKERKYCLDIVPATKKDAVDYLAKVSGIKKGLVAGDSGNDIEMLLETGNFNAVLVGGYKPEAGAAVSGAEKNVEKKGKRSFQRVITPSGEVKAVYVEQGKRLAGESILQAAEILRRAENIKRIREEKI